MFGFHNDFFCHLDYSNYPVYSTDSVQSVQGNLHIKLLGEQGQKKISWYYIQQFSGLTIFSSGFICTNIDIKNMQMNETV